MKISYNWLCKYIKTDLSVEKIASILTDTGLEVEDVEEIESVKGSLKGVVVGEVIECEKHPNADKLKLTKVNLGDQTVQIVCGAPNVEKGQKVPVATIGTSLYSEDGSEFKIKKSKIRGEESFGMICAEDELGLGKSHEGILVLDTNLKVGTPLNEVIPVSKDYCIEIGLTPNRTDAMSHYGVARDLYAALKSRKIKAELQPITFENFKLDEVKGNPISVEVENQQLCPRYSGIYLKNIEIKPSPDWLQNQLRIIGLSPINNAVDITNYILHSYGLPLHAFDADKIGGQKIKVGTVPEGTAFTTLDGVKRNLSDSELLIKDAQDTPLCLAGVYGGLESGVSNETKNIFLEAAYFDPVSIRKTSKKEGLNTDSSFRFERGVDPNYTLIALKKACELFKELTHATVVGEMIDIYPNPIKNVNTILRYHKIDRILGKKIHREQIKEILKSLEFTIISDTNEVLDLIVPAYRVDVTREIDVIEEIARIYGYNQIDIPEKFSFAYENKNAFDEEFLENTIANQLKYNGFNEIINNSLTSRRNENNQYVELVNPLSTDLCVMRQSLIYGVLQSISFNSNRNQKEIKFYEFGKTYFKNSAGTYIENKKLSVALFGNFQENNWIIPQNTSTFFHLKGIVSQLLTGFNISIDEKPLESSSLYKDGIELFVNGSSLGKLGSISPKLLKEFGLKGNVFYAELEWEKWVDLASKKKPYKLAEIPKFPGSTRDLALLLDKDIKYFDLYKAAFETEKKLLQSVNLFDVYEGKNLPEGKKSYALNFFLQDENKTLTDQDIDKVMKKLLDRFSTQFHAELRNN
ncbi:MULTISPECIES: phenylalanine--tRNA ligase subunit beta [unclassified Apibacter]|uniref:phenylalanine--tRNA ligase subunit beta n=1 Tax=unclassified Apibacter TaxID=2630820 RepID=UPI00132C18F5|nr:MULTISPECIES: phenylalanine--tRNA ligase subunit beta [unclassified Apibacter]MCX8677527.1 phenylalanine--tRNA ligase subunit beta [Apibacter sp. B3919]MXO24269.1 phenylalanine--tRNA ligase subunit beta [Apibacter sp. B3924]MXO27058.1 phenylalanine--tRNA ligase subunit beta [Apibacter sp. B3813]MXO28815.1 phenylalanine--tRNA ligase subunit beta [Apibacter sp. B3913]MXO30766.1 phenylalanine--tRNA ligase subunit beta [Apibacter sp. B3912]